MTIPAAHLTRKEVFRTQSSTRAFPLKETAMPHYDGSVDSIRKIIDWLDVEKSARYKRDAKSTYCNIYAYDYAYLLGAYLPRVWWTDSELKAGKFKEVKYGVTVREMNANSLYAWFPEYGPAFGWKKAENFADAQAAANAGKCVIMVCANKDKKKSGHIVAIVPETDQVKAVGSSGIGTRLIIVQPVQSQAGAKNHKYYNARWWSGMDAPRVYIHG